MGSKCVFLDGHKACWLLTADNDLRAGRACARPHLTRVNNMELLDTETRARLPKLYATQNDDDPIAYARLDARWQGWTWYILEFDGHDVCYGYVCGFERELGYFNLAELESFRGPRWQRVERDPHFTPTPVSVVRMTSN